MKTILIVDDSTFMRSIIKKMISGLDVVVAGEAENGKIGVEKYKELNPDIVTMDLNMNEMTGLEALKEILCYDPDASVIMVSALGGQEPIIEEAMSLGAKGVLVKPFKEPQILRILRDL
ncbi:MAG: response regulator [Oscillospiraceae bacterium]|nr:response regulator [Oscillospiraceae bacterium]